MVKKIFRLPKVLDATGDGRSAIYLKISNGTFPPPVNLGPRSVGWPDYEVDTINAARIAGKSEEEIKALVLKLVAARKNAGNDGFSYPSKEERDD